MQVNPALAVGTDGVVYARLSDVRGSPRLAGLLAELEDAAGGVIFVGVVVPGLDARTVLRRFDDCAAETVAMAVGRQRRRRTVRRS